MALLAMRVHVLAIRTGWCARMVLERRITLVHRHALRGTGMAFLAMRKHVLAAHACLCAGMVLFAE